MPDELIDLRHVAATSRGQRVGCVDAAAGNRGRYDTFQRYWLILFMMYILYIFDMSHKMKRKYILFV
jgi:hypothetical protein